ncbi:MAG: hypothetical protein IKB88_02205 [Clostridia bacterium]|nr:hypothetical protein [Clostridia bacterium]
MTDRALFPVFAPNTHSGGVKLGKLMNVSVAESFTQLSGLNEYRQVFNYAAVTLGSTYISSKAYEKAFGAYVTKDLIVDQPLMGIPGKFGYIKRDVEDGMKKWCVVWIERITFSPPPDSAITKASSTTFVTPSITGMAHEDGTGWRKKFFFTSLKEAREFLETKAGVNY